MFSARISGSHFNPCITFSYMLGNVKHGKFDRILGFLYIIAQIVGALLGAFIGKIFYSGHKEATVPGEFEYGIRLNVAADDIVQSIIVEIMGSFFLVFMYLSSTEDKTKFTKDSAVQTIILAGSYLGAMFLAGTKIQTLQASPVNPAIAMAIIWWHSSWDPSKHSADNWKTGWLFMTFSFAGSALALIFFRFVYQKTTEQIEEDEDAMEEQANQDDLLDS